MLQLTPDDRSLQAPALEQSKRRTKYFNWLILAFALVVYILSRLPYLQEPVLWIDEAFSIFYAKKSLFAIWGADWHIDPTPPLYYSFLWFWTRGIGDSEALARLSSVMMMGVATWIVFIIATEIANRRAGFVAAVLFACHPLVFEYSLELRAYALNSVIVAAGIWAFARALQALEEGRGACSADVVRLTLPIVACCVLSCYTHATSFIFVASLVFCAAIYGLLRCNRREYWVSLFCACGVFLVLVTPQLYATLSVMSLNQPTLVWIPPPSDLLWLYITGRALLLGQYSYGSSTTEILGVFAVGALIWSAWGTRKQLVLVLIGIVLPIAAILLLIFVSLWQPIFLPRTILWTLMPLTILVGCRISAVAWNWWSRTAFMVGVLLLAHMTVANMTGRNFWRPWHAIIREQLLKAQPGDLFVAADTEILCVLDYYSGNIVPPEFRRVLYLGSGQKWQMTQRVDLNCNRRPQASISSMTDQMRKGGAVWLMAWSNLQVTDIETVLYSLADEIEVTDRVQWNGMLVAVRIAPRPYPPD